MKELFLIVDIIFFELAKENFNFPITNPIRTSFWLIDSEHSTFSEIQIQDEYIEIGKICRIGIKLLERDFLQNKIKQGAEFSLGVFPSEIAYGRVVDIL